MTPGVVGELSILGTKVRVAAETRELLDGLESVYASVPRGPARREIAVRLRGRGAGGALLETPAGDLVGHGESSAAAAAAIGFGLFHQLVGGATEHLVLHAAAVVQGSGAVLIVAPSRVGKTTLAVTRALDGAGFLSDEAAPIERSTGLVAPMPRAVGIRPGPLAERLRSVCGTSPTVTERGGRRKHLVDLVGRGLARAGQPARPRHVVFLVPATRGDQPVVRGGARLRDWCLDVDRVTAPLLTGLRAAAGVVEVAASEGDGARSVRIQAEASALVSLAVEQAAAAGEVTVIRLVEAEYADIAYDGEVELREIAPRDGVMRLARHLENGAGSALLAGAGSAGMLVMELASALVEARYWDLSAGPLVDMSRLIAGLR